MLLKIRAGAEAQAIALAAMDKERSNIVTEALRLAVVAVVQVLIEIDIAVPTKQLINYYEKNSIYIKLWYLFSVGNQLCKSSVQP